MEQTRSKIVGLFLAGKSPKEILNSFKDEKVCRQLVYRTIRRYKDTGSVQDRARTGRPTSVCTQQLKKKISSRISRNPRRSIRKMARDFSVSHESVRKVVRNELGLKSLKLQTVHHLTPTLRQKRFERCKKFWPGSQWVLKIIFFFQMKKFSPLKNLIISKTIVYSFHHQRTSEMRRNLLIGYKNRSI